MNLIGYDSDFYNQAYGSFPLKKKCKQIFFSKIGKRKLLHKRDKGICQLCKKNILISEISFDHIVPKSKGGNNKWSNLQISHSCCNWIKGSDEQREPEHYINNSLYNVNEI
jgi:5-methylcytosine-specific restriction endonuclease McrA